MNAVVLLIPTGCTVAEAVEKHFAVGGSQNYKLMQYVVSHLAFVELQRQNYAMVVDVVNDILSLHKQHALLPDVHITLITYAAEALCHINRPSHALKVLQAASFSELVSSSEKLDGQRQRVECLFANLCIVHIATSSWKQAQTLINSLMSKFTASGNASPTSPGFKSAILLQIFLELAQGNKERAQEIFAKYPISPPASA